MIYLYIVGILVSLVGAYEAGFPGWVAGLAIGFELVVLNILAEELKKRQKNDIRKTI